MNATDDRDARGQLLHYLPDALEACGVSRFRVASKVEWPLTAHVISRPPVDYDDDVDTPGVYVAVDTQGGGLIHRHVQYPASDLQDI
ncbi:uncharacterized protein PG986_004624 [Apiospora aurea]|uniref:Uncharacterized protein n=1 Tax=Apiospora aurea TaxID=335848 RepID=A0ABR1QNW1_9PEZI